jgi:hypothetical protein
MREASGMTVGGIESFDLVNVGAQYDLTSLLVPEDDIFDIS